MIREAVKEDITAISKIHVDGWKYAYKGILPEDFLQNRSYEEQSNKWNNRYFNNEDTTEIVLVAEKEEGEVVGFISLDTVSKIEGVEGSIGALYIDTSHHGKGYGTALFKAAVDILKKQGMKNFVLTAFKENKKACRFYEALGGIVFSEKTEIIGGIEAVGITYIFEG